MAILKGHIGELHGFYGEFMGVRIARKHFGWYLTQKPRGLRQGFNALEDASAQLDYIDNLNITLCHEDIAA